MNTTEQRRELRAIARVEKRVIAAGAKAQRLAARDISNLKSLISKNKVAVKLHLKRLARRRKIIEGRLGS